MSREDETPEGCRDDFLSMNQEMWDAMMDSSHGGAFLTQTEQQGLAMAITEKIRRKQEQHNREHPRCEQCKLDAARMAYDAGLGRSDGSLNRRTPLGASGWEAFIHHVPICDDCDKVAAVLWGKEGES